ncbi:NAD(P)-dependent oxidoreductase [Mycolicibacterium vanbaalenii]|uniref:NAD(P)-dependent oxidoreductase n=1 Tax=Mycolicibacterium vanbaalenii TaxID=110539 RepID=UPI000A00F0D7|nr:NAD(P)-dependent oxidoreductase [Mycolicibacterium vanbaalenii]
MAEFPLDGDMKVCVIGLGEVGLKFAGMAAASGYEVVGVDTSRERRDQATCAGEVSPS